MSGAVPLPDRVDAQAVEMLRSELLEASGDITLDGSRVSMLGTLGVQVLLSARAHFSECGRQITITSPSADFLDCIADLGVSLDRLETKGAPQ